jgi:hypothetical protein
MCVNKKAPALGHLGVGEDAPNGIRVTENDTLIEHPAVMQLRSRDYGMIDREMLPAQQRVEKSKP